MKILENFAQNLIPKMRTRGNRVGITSKIGELFRKKIRNKWERSKLKNSDFTIISNTCIAGKIYHDLGLRFLTPTINLYIKPEQFVKFCNNLSYYIDQPIFQVTGNYKYPVGRIDDIFLYFKHYKTFDEAVNKWNERKSRIVWDNIFIMMTDRHLDIENGANASSCSDNIFESFDKLPFKNKICFCAKQHEQKSCFQLYEYSRKQCVGVITNIVNCFGKRMYQLSHFDYVAWLNNDKSK